VKKILLTVAFIVAISSLSGCAMLGKNTRVSKLEEENQRLRDKLLMQEKSKDQELERAKEELMQQLSKELGDYKAKLEMTERGLVITFLAEVFFNPGKDVVLEEGKNVLTKVAGVLNKDVPDSNVAVEGHTDNDPIKYSGWKSNWELSSARALSVLHYFVDDCKVNPDRLSANGYGEFRPVASNDTLEGKKKNRRVEIVILPAQISKVKAQ
jgi:chemotaxis protein MotB